jgi:hypothetical protein
MGWLIVRVAAAICLVSSASAQDIYVGGAGIGGAGIAGTAGAGAFSGQSGLKLENHDSLSFSGGFLRVAPSPPPAVLHNETLHGHITHCDELARQQGRCH